jgi:hypothetical protein
MKRQKNSENDVILWDDLLKSESAYFTARQNFLQNASNRIAILREALKRVAHRGTALRVLSCLDANERQQLFDELVNLASVGHADIVLVREAILSLPRAWVVSHIEDQARPLLDRGTYEEYRRFLELYRDLDPELTRRLAQLALQNHDPDVREAGEDALGWLTKSPPP